MKHGFSDPRRTVNRIDSHDLQATSYDCPSLVLNRSWLVGQRSAASAFCSLFLVSVEGRESRENIWLARASIFSDASFSQRSKFSFRVCLYVRSSFRVGATAVGGAVHSPFPTRLPRTYRDFPTRSRGHGSSFLSLERLPGLGSFAWRWFAQPCCLQPGRAETEPPVTSARVEHAHARSHIHPLVFSIFPYKPLSSPIVPLPPSPSIPLHPPSSSTAYFLPHSALIFLDTTCDQLIERFALFFTGRSNEFLFHSRAFSTSQVASDWIAWVWVYVTRRGTMLLYVPLASKKKKKKKKKKHVTR